MLDPEQIEADEITAAHLRAIAALAGTFYDALRACGLPDGLAVDMVSAWHETTLDESPVDWTDLGGE